MLPYRDLGEVKCVDCGAIFEAKKQYFHYEDNKHIDAVMRQHSPDFLKRIEDAARPGAPRQKR